MGGPVGIPAHLGHTASLDLHLLYSRHRSEAPYGAAQAWARVHTVPGKLPGAPELDTVQACALVCM